MPMPNLDAKTLTNHLAGLRVSEVSVRRDGALMIQFTNGSALVVEPAYPGLAASLVTPAARTGGRAAANQPTSRQREYLALSRNTWGGTVLRPQRLTFSATSWCRRHPSTK
jgi:hypothetical protein